MLLFFAPKSYKCVLICDENILNIHIFLFILFYRIKIVNKKITNN